MSNLTKKMQEISDRVEKASPGEWGARVNEFSNLARARFIWDSTWGFVGEFHGSQAEVNADFVANAKQDIPRLVKALEACMEQRRRMTYNELTEDERKMFFTNKVLDSMDQELEAILEGK